MTRVRHRRKDFRSWLRDGLYNIWLASAIDRCTQGSETGTGNETGTRLVPRLGWPALRDGNRDAASIDTTQRAANTSCPRSDRFWLLDLRVSETFLDQLRPQLSGSFGLLACPLFAARHRVIIWELLGRAALGTGIQQMRRFRAVAMLAFLLILTSLSFADDASVRSRESFNASWRFARFGPQADGSTRPEPGAERWSIVASASSEEAAKGNVAENAFDGDQATRWCASFCGVITSSSSRSRAGARSSRWAMATPPATSRSRPRIAAPTMASAR